MCIYIYIYIHIFLYNGKVTWWKRGPHNRSHKHLLLADSRTSTSNSRWMIKSVGRNFLSNARASREISPSSSPRHCKIPRMSANSGSIKVKTNYMNFARPLGLEVCVINSSIVNRRPFFSLVVTLRRQIVLLAEGSNPLFRPLGAPRAEYSCFFWTPKSDWFLHCFLNPFLIAFCWVLAPF